MTTGVTADHSNASHSLSRVVEALDVTSSHRAVGFPSWTSPVRIRSAAPLIQGVTGQPVAPSASRITIEEPQRGLQTLLSEPSGRVRGVAPSQIRDELVIAAIDHLRVGVPELPGHPPGRFAGLKHSAATRCAAAGHITGIGGRTPVGPRSAGRVRPSQRSARLGRTPTSGRCCSRARQSAASCGSRS